MLHNTDHCFTFAVIIALLDCIVLPAFRQRSPALEQRFPEHKASLHTSSEISLDTLLMELGASVKVDCENIISVYRML